ncbi:Hypothetical predicted protein [Cloeon dipterum]|uniref:Uncharacterized protein n=1 Tax=Cloeon dipterum TaxID=197152 RepID=A0A8S1D5J5_9INSE|nr:Hypothetical predicted protein [Cloeon dipterum]
MPDIIAVVNSAPASQRTKESRLVGGETPQQAPAGTGKEGLDEAHMLRPSCFRYVDKGARGLTKQKASLSPNSEESLHSKFLQRVFVSQRKSIIVWGIDQAPSVTLICDFGAKRWQKWREWGAGSGGGGGGSEGWLHWAAAKGSSAAVNRFVHPVVCATAGRAWAGRAVGRLVFSPPPRATGCTLQPTTLATTTRSAELPK